MTRKWASALTLLALSGAEPARPAEPADSACVSCHGNADFFDADGLAVVESFANDAHAAAGLSCHDCHGGNPDPSLAEDLGAAMDESYAADPYRGSPSRMAAPAFCGRCHSDITYMRRFNPRARVDQETEYKTSHHGRALARGDQAVATCVDCHGAHGILGPESPSSRVHPRRVAETCRECHADPERMAGRTLPGGRPLPIDQYARWRQSVHATALLEREDLSAPTCNDCHGNHGAAPPGLHSISFVCGQCHGREAEVFRASAKWEGFEGHNELLPEAGPEGCAACHDPLPSQPAAAQLASFSECSTCHGNHGVVRPTVAMLSPLPETPCTFCHSDTEGETAEPQREPQRAMEAALVSAGREQQLDGDALFDHLVDEALKLPTHTLPGPEGATLRPEFERLWQKLRLGKTHFSYPDPTTGEPVRGEIVRCGGCHSAGSSGLETAGALLHQMRELTTRTARAERILLAARRGGVETASAALEVDRAVDSQIELQVLVHGFESGEGTTFDATWHEGQAHALAALEAGEAALSELAYRRIGLGVALVFIVLVLIGLALKIRQFPS